MLKTTTTIVLWPLYTSTCITWHFQLRTGGFCQCKVLLPTCPCWQQPAIIENHYNWLCLHNQIVCRWQTDETIARTVYICVWITACNYNTQYSTQQFWLSSLLTPSHHHISTLYNKIDDIYVRSKANWFRNQKRKKTKTKNQTHTHTHPFNGPMSRTTRVGRYQKGKTNLDFTGARDSEWQWHQLGHMQVCTSLQTDNHANTPSLSFYRPDALPVAQPTASKHWRQKPKTRHAQKNNASTKSTELVHSAEERVYSMVRKIFKRCVLTCSIVELEDNSPDVTSSVPVGVVP